jgi:hypothetical protein
MEVFRIGDNLINIDGLNVYNPKGDTNWYSFNNKRIGTIRLQALYLYLHYEEKDRKKRFYKYVEDIIDKLIYN